jgi:hypothetical protein
MNPENYEMAKTMFIEGYEGYETIEDIGEFISRIIIPYFKLFACDLEELVNIIKTKTDSPNEVLGYLEVIFNSKLYDSYLYANNSQLFDNYSYYLIILIEFTKYQQYQNIKEKLEIIETAHSSDDKNCIQDILMKATIERSQHCLDKMKVIYTELLNKFSLNTNSIIACNELFNANNIKLV